MNKDSFFDLFIRPPASLSSLSMVKRITLGAKSLQPSIMRCRDSNLGPVNREPSKLTTKPGCNIRKKKLDAH